ncbi:hypothetical protein HPB50_023452 [Hyalomma asiaticum]|uniref:Uncharacterized protein n=1 Tax=Hyalomma asiaticum TaxID=266040 RepID=A0ACB7TQ23_HYAAI|nr:hypothetical protein HPB50_023452 [Hyalomma asiaticum]
MASSPEDFPPSFTLSSTMGRSRAYDLLLREAGNILNFPPSRVPLSPRRRTHRTKRAPLFGSLATEDEWINHLRSPDRALEHQAVQKAQKVAGELRLPVPTWAEPPGRTP